MLGGGGLGYWPVGGQERGDVGLGEVGVWGVEPFLEFEDEGGGFGVAAEFDEGSCGREVLDLGELLFPVAEDEAFEVGAFGVGEVVAGGVGDKDLKFFVESGRRVFGEEVGDLFFAVEDNGEKDEEPDGAENDDEGLVSAEFMGWDGFGVAWFGQGIERVDDGDLKSGGEVFNRGFGVGVAEEGGDWMGAGVEGVGFEVVAEAIGRGLDFEDADDEGGLVVFAGDDFDFRTGDVEVGDGGGEAEGS
ncbi:MAG: hypothetical protein ACJAVK_002256 [Akkermansiaceae bacterium]|jgi:hypothetical protein